MIPIPKKIKSENHREYAYRIIRENVMSLRLQPGTTISETKLAERLGISRTPVREAIGELKNENLLLTFPQQATIVAPINLQYVREGFLLRNLVEPKIFHQIAGTLDRNLVQQFQNNLAEQLNAIKKEKILTFNTLDDEFHQLLYLAARKETIWSTRKTVTGHYDRLRYLVIQEKIIPCINTYRDHETLFTYLLTGLTTAVELLYEQHFGAYQEHVPALQEQLPAYFAIPSAK